MSMALCAVLLRRDTGPNSAANRVMHAVSATFFQQQLVDRGEFLDSRLAVRMHSACVRKQAVTGVKPRANAAVSPIVDCRQHAAFDLVKK